MNTILILARQILQMFLLAVLGFLLFRGKKITQEGSRALGNILIYLALPATIINGFLVERTAEHLLGVLYSALAAAVLLLVSAGGMIAGALGMVLAIPVIVSLRGALRGWRE